ncbi:hypothetical protein [Streptomyces pratensis]|uniref:hypothetical protein n=1 Tax=Streptomyces pratensis TaxID=1169025 RepID=UPI00301718E4
MGRRSLDGERRTVSTSIQRGDHAMARGQWALAPRHWQGASRHAVTVARAGRGDQDRAALGSVSCNLAELHVKAGNVSMAWVAALQACQVYSPLGPTAARPTVVASCLRPWLRVCATGAGSPHPPRTSRRCPAPDGSLSRSVSSVRR